MDSDSPNAAKIDDVARDWVAYQRTESTRYAWAADEVAVWGSTQEFEVIRRLVLGIARYVAPEEEHVVGMLGAGPLEDMVHGAPGEALGFLEVEIVSNAALREAATSVWSRSDANVRQRLDEMLVRYGKSGSER